MHTVLNDEAQFSSWRHSFENQAEMDGFNRLIEDKFADKAAFRASLTDQYYILLFDAQHATLLRVFKKVLQIPKSKDLYWEYCKKTSDAIKAWHFLLLHQKGSDASLEAAC